MPWKARPPKVTFFHFPDALAEGFFLPRLALVQHVSARPASGGRGPDVRRKFPRHVSEFYIPGKATLTVSLPSSPPVTHQPSATSHLSPRTFHYSSPVIDHPPPITITHHPSFRQPAISSVSLPSHHFHHYYSYLPPINHQLSATCGHSFISPHRSPVTHYSPLITHHSPFISQQTVARPLARPLCDDNRPSDERPST